MILPIVLSGVVLVHLPGNKIACHCDEIDILPLLNHFDHVNRGDVVVTIFPEV